MTFLVVLVLAALAQAQTFTVLHDFEAADGANPVAGVIRDSRGNFYGTTPSGGYDFGVLRNPYARVVLDSEGNIYGNTFGCGANKYNGTVWELNKKGTLTLLHSFAGTDGSWPYGELLRTGNGELFGTTSGGGSDSCASGCGTLWSYVP